MKECRPVGVIIPATTTPPTASSPNSFGSQTLGTTSGRRMAGSEGADLLEEAVGVDNLPVLGHLAACHTIHVDPTKGKSTAGRRHPEKFAYMSAGVAPSEDHLFMLSDDVVNNPLWIEGQPQPRHSLLQASQAGRLALECRVIQVVLVGHLIKSLDVTTVQDADLVPAQKLLDSEKA